MNSDTNSSNPPAQGTTSLGQSNPDDQIINPEKSASPKEYNDSSNLQNSSMNNENKNNRFQSPHSQGEQDVLTEYHPSTLTYSSQQKSPLDQSLNFRNKGSKDFAHDSLLGTNFLSSNDTQPVPDMTIEEVEQRVDENLKKIQNLEHFLNNQLNKLTAGKDSGISARGFKSPDKGNTNNAARLRSPALAGMSALKASVFNSPTIPRSKENYLGMKSDLMHPSLLTAGPNLRDKLNSIGDRFDVRTIDLRRAEGAFRRPLYSNIESFRSPERTHSYKSSYDQLYSPNPYSAVTSPSKYAGGLLSDRYSHDKPGSRWNNQWGSISQDPSLFPHQKKRAGSNFEEILDSTRKLINEIRAGPTSQRSSQLLDL